MPTRETTARARSGRCGQKRAHQQAAVAAAHHRQFVRAGVLAFDHVFGAGDEIVEDILFVGEVAGPVPGFAKFAAAAQIGDGINAASIEPEAARGTERRGQVDAVAAVTREQRRIFSVQFDPFFRRILMGIFVPSFEVANSRTTSMSSKFAGDVMRNAVARGSFMPGSHSIPAGRIEETGVGKQHFIAEPAAQPAHR